MADQTSSTVDETPISPVREARGRQNSLEKHLQHRPEQQELKDRHILLDTNAAPWAHYIRFLIWGVYIGS